MDQKPSLTSFAGLLILGLAIVLVATQFAAAMLFGRGEAELTNCRANLREIGNAVMMFQEAFGNNRDYPWDEKLIGSEWFCVFTSESEGGATTLAGGATVTLPNPEILVCPATDHEIPQAGQGSPSYAGRLAPILNDVAGIPLACDAGDHHDGRFCVLRLPTQVRVMTGDPAQDAPGWGTEIGVSLAAAAPAATPAPGEDWTNKPEREIPPVPAPNQPKEEPKE